MRFRVLILAVRARARGCRAGVVPPPVRGRLGNRAQRCQQADGDDAEKWSLHKDVPLRTFLTCEIKPPLLYEGTPVASQGRGVGRAPERPFFPRFVRQIL